MFQCAIMTNLVIKVVECLCLRILLILQILCYKRKNNIFLGLIHCYLTQIPDHSVLFHIDIASCVLISSVIIELVNLHRTLHHQQRQLPHHLVLGNPCCPCSRGNLSVQSSVITLSMISQSPWKVSAMIGTPYSSKSS